MLARWTVDISRVAGPAPVREKHRGVGRRHQGRRLRKMPALWAAAGGRRQAGRVAAHTDAVEQAGDCRRRMPDRR